MYHYVKFLQRKSLLSGSYFWFGRNNNLLSKNLCSIPSFYTVKDTRFNGVYVNISSKSQSIEEFESTLKGKSEMFVMMTTTMSFYSFLTESSIFSKIIFSKMIASPVNMKNFVYMCRTVVTVADTQHRCRY